MVKANKVIRGQINLLKAFSAFSAFSDILSENDAEVSFAIALMVSNFIIGIK